MGLSGEVLPLLSQQRECIRNVCILAHVDHGKTTLADALLATNGIISFRQAGKLRYMDNTEAEQERGITMKSSAASLFYNPSVQFRHGHTSPETATSKNSYLINLIDSPGHVDFASDVSTAVRLCDGAVVVVDVVEGVCPQTRAVLRQAWNERLSLILLINKIDRLFIQLKLSSLEVYDRLLRILEQVNSVLAEMFTADVLQKNYERSCSERESQCDETVQCGTGATYTWSTGLESTDDSHVYFSPDRANVIFASAIDGWGFRISDIVDLWAERLKIPKKGLLKILWGDYYLIPGRDGAPPKANLHARTKGKKPVFVQLIIDQIYNIYKTLLLEENNDKAPMIAEKLGVRLESRLLRNSDNRTVLRSITSAWLPLGSSIFETIVEICPSPVNAISKQRAMYMLFGESVGHLNVRTDGAKASVDAAEMATDDESDTDESASFLPAVDALQKCNAAVDAPVIIFVSKVFWTERQALLSNGTSTRPKTIQITSDQISVPLIPRTATTMSTKPMSFALPGVRSKNSDENLLSGNEFIALSRIYSGQVHIGQRLFVLGPKFDGSKVPEYMLDCDPIDFPLGPLHLPEPEDLFSGETRGSNISSVVGSSPSSSMFSRSLSGASVDSRSSSVSGRRILKHVYVAEVSDAVQFAGGQNDVARLSDPRCPVSYLPAGNVIGLIGPSLIASLPKSGLLVSRLRLVASPDLFTINAEIEDGDEEMRGPIRRVQPLAGLVVWHGAPVISLAVEPASASDPEDMTRLENGLRLLERSDPCAEVTISPKGEYLLHAAGEVHMQKCLEELTKYFAPELELHTSQFLVPFRETVTKGCPPDSFIPIDTLRLAQQQLEADLHRLNLMYDADRDNCVRLMTVEERAMDASNGTANSAISRTGAMSMAVTAPATNSATQRITIASTSSLAEQRKYHRSKHNAQQVDITRWLPLGILQLPHCKSKTRVFIRITAHPVPPKLLTWMESRATAYIPKLLRAMKQKSGRGAVCLKSFEAEFSNLLDSLSAPNQGTDTRENTPTVDWPSLKNQLVCMGPSQTGPNLLFSRLNSRFFRLNTAWGKPVPTWHSGSEDSLCESLSASATLDAALMRIPFLSYGKALIQGFQMATAQGPLCAEPMRGVAFILEEIYAEDRHQLPTPRILTAADFAEESTDEALFKQESTNVDSGPVQDDCILVSAVNASDVEENDPILLALKAKQTAVQMRKKTQRLVSWLSPDDNDAGSDDASLSYDDEDNWEYDEDKNPVIDTDRRSESSQSDGDTGEGDAVEPEKKLRLSEYFYWKRRNDTEWLSDVTPGLMTPAMARACIAAYQACPGQRLVLAMYDVELQARSDVLGRMYGVLRKRYGRVISEDLREGEECFVIHARLPVVESFGLTSELRKRTSGIVSLPQLRPGGWEVLDIDPLLRDAAGNNAVSETHTNVYEWQQEALCRYFRKTHRPGEATGEEGRASSESEQEDELLLDEVNTQVARLRSYIREVRQRKGLSLHEQLVVSADKQRTLKRNK